MKPRSFKAPLLVAFLAGLALVEHGAAPTARLSGDDAGSTPARVDRPRLSQVAVRRPVPARRPASPPALAAILGHDATTRREAWQRALPRMTGTYLPDVIREGNSLAKRWGDRWDDPVRVWIAPGDSVAGWQHGFAAVVRQAFAEWERVGVPVRFAFVATPAEAEVHLSWLERLPDHRAGVIHWSGDANGWLAHARIELAMHVSDGGAANDASMRRIALHEIGHLLGLEHSADSADVMAAWVEAGDLTERDRATARLLYTLPPGELAPGWDATKAS